MSDGGFQPDGDVVRSPQMQEAAARRKRLRSIIGFAIGIVLLGAAAWAVFSQHAVLEQARINVSGAPWWLIAAAIVLPVVNWLVVSGSFWLMIRRHGAVGLGEMVWLIGASWLMNYLPLRAGLVGRVAYHKTVNNIRIADSLRVTAYGLAYAAVSIMVLLLAAVVFAGRAPAMMWGAILAAPVVIAGVVLIGALAKGSAAWWLPASFALRYIDTLIWVVRYIVVFALVGVPIDVGAAVVIAGVSQVAVLVSIAPNGLGLREWAVGLTVAALPAGLIGTGIDSANAIGLAADLTNRAAEVLVAVPAGLAAIWVLAHRTRSAAGETSVTGGSGQATSSSG